MHFTISVLDLINECNRRIYCRRKILSDNTCDYYKECEVFKEKFHMTPEELGKYRFIDDIKQGEFIWK